MRLSTRMAFAALLLGSTFGMTTIAAHAATPGCPSATQKTEGEGGAGGNWQSKPGAGVQKTESEGGAGGGTQQAGLQKTEGEGGAGGNWQSKPGAGVQKTEAEGGAGGGRQQAMATPCK
jgi:hypothetical protein